MTVNKVAKESYHDIFVPLLDVYDEGGTLVFTEFDRTKSDERNLIVVPMSYLDKLADIKESGGGWGASDSLKYIKDSKVNKLPEKCDDNFFLYRLTQGLDMCLINDSTFSRSGLDINTLEKKILENAQFLDSTRDNPQKIKIITGDDRYHIKYSLNDFVVQDPEFLMANEDIVNEGIIFGNDKLASRIYATKDGKLPIAEVRELLGGKRLYMNQFVKFSGAQTGYAVVTGNILWNQSETRITDIKDMHLELIKHMDYKKLRLGESTFDNIVGISPQDAEQYLAMQYILLNKNVSMKFLAGGAGSGKTVLAWAYALDSALIYDVEERKKRGLPIEGKSGSVKKVLLIKAIETLGGSRKDIGFLPGNLYEKLKPHLEPYTGAHELTSLSGMAFEELFRHPDYKNDWGDPRDPRATSFHVNSNAHFPPRNELVRLVHSGTVGGASIPNTAFFIDEAQDFTPYEMKVILERVGLGSTVTITGDPKQLRNPKCTVKKNGLTFALKSYLPKHYSGLIALTHNYRHQISEDARDLKAYPG